MMNFSGVCEWYGKTAFTDSDHQMSSKIWKPIDNGRVIGNKSVVSDVKQISEKQRRHLERLEAARLAKVEKKMANLAKQEQANKEKQRKKEEALAKNKADIQRKALKKSEIEKILLMNHKKKVERKRHSTAQLMAEQAAKKQRMSELAKQHTEKLALDIADYYANLDEKTSLLVKTRLSDLADTPGTFTLGCTDTEFSSGCLIPLPSDQPWGTREKVPEERMNFGAMSSLLENSFHLSPNVKKPAPLNFEIGKVEAKKELNLPKLILPTSGSERARMLSHLSSEDPPLVALKLGTFLVNRVLTLPQKMREGAWTKIEQVVTNSQSGLSNKDPESLSS